jgi:hypothetical protein
MTTPRTPITTLFLPLAFLAVLLTACGDDSGGSASSDGIAAEAPADVDTSNATPGGVGHWSALELCSLSDPEAVAQLFPGKNIVEATGLDDPDWSVCLYNDTDADPLAPESTLLTISTNDWDGTEFADSATPLDLEGAEQSVLFDNFDGSDANVLVAVGDVSLSVTYDIGTDGGAELGEQIATTWLKAQNAG